MTGRELAASERTQQRIELSNERFREVILRGAAQNKKVLMTPQDPILLIDGKYLLTGPVTGRIKDQLRMANWIIGKRIEKLAPDHATKSMAEIERMDWKRIKYGEEDGARTERAVQIEPRMNTESNKPVTVEWFYSYGNKVSRKIERQIQGWGRRLPAEVELIESPVVPSRWGDGDAEQWHQKVIAAGRPVIWENTIREYSPQSS